MKHESRPVALAVTEFVTVAAILLFYDSLFGQRVVVNIGRQLLQAVQPILYGAFIAYLLSPLVDFFEGHLFASAVAKARSAGRISRGARAVSLILTWLMIYVLFHLLASILLVMAVAILAAAALSLCFLLIISHYSRVNSPVEAQANRDMTGAVLEYARGLAVVKSFGRDIPLEHFDIAFDHVSFGYDDRQVLHDVSFTIPEKTSTAIVGPSSSGKTTLCFAVQRAEDLLRKVERVVFALLVGQARIRSKIFQRQGIFLCQRAGGS